MCVFVAFGLVFDVLGTSLVIFTGGVTGSSVGAGEEGFLFLDCRCVLRMDGVRVVLLAAFMNVVLVNSGAGVVAVVILRSSNSVKVPVEDV